VVYWHISWASKVQVAPASDEDADDVLRDYELSGDEDSGDEVLGQSGNRARSAGDNAANSDEDGDDDLDDARAPLSRDDAGKGRASRQVGKISSGGGASQKPLKRGNRRGRGRGRRIS